jgi:proteasome lid subunit RPN8/RPN11
VHDFKSDAVAHAMRVYPNESCGLVVDGKYFPCRNACDNPAEGFAIDPRDYLAAHQSGIITAVVHSHPEGQSASELDLKACQQSKLVWHIYQVPQQEWLTIEA